jgi:hypothetical protein
MRRVLMIVIAVLLLSGRADMLMAAQKPVVKKVHHILVLDTGKLVVRHLDTAALNKYSKDPDFNYNHEKELQQESLWERFWNWFWGWVGRLFPRFSGGKNLASVLKYLLYGAAAFLFIYLILKLLKIDLLKLFRKHKNEEGLPFTEFSENIHDINFDDSISKALLDKNYRLAVRLLYLRSLKRLNDAGMIHWKLEKTNLAYLNELENPEYKKLFGALTVSFEYVWYGDFPINGEVFQNIDSLFRDFNTRLK